MSHTNEKWPEPTIETRIRPDGVMNVVGEIKGIAVFESHSDAVRAVADHNACAGMADPAKEIQELRKLSKLLAQEPCNGAIEPEDERKQCPEIYGGEVKHYCPSCLARHTLKGNQ